MKASYPYVRREGEPAVGWLKKRLYDSYKRERDPDVDRIERNYYYYRRDKIERHMARYIQRYHRGRQVRKLTRGMTKSHGLVYNPYIKRQVRYTKPTTRIVYNPYAKTHTKIKLGKPTHRLIYNPYSKTYSKHECRSPLCGCS